MMNESKESTPEIVQLDQAEALQQKALIPVRPAIVRRSKTYIAVNLLVSATSGIAGLTLAKSADALEGVMHMPPDAIDSLDAVSVVCVIAMNYMIFDQLKLRPRGATQFIFSAFGLFSSLPMFTGAYLGAREGYHQSVGVSVSTASFMYCLRMLLCNHAAVCLPQNLAKIRSAFREGGVKEKSAAGAAFIIAAAYSFCASNTAYLAPAIIFELLKQAPAPAFFYTAGVLGAIGIFPLALFVTYNGTLALGQPEVSLAVKIPTVALAAAGSLIGMGSIIAGTNPITEGVCGMNHLGAVLFGSISSLAVSVFTSSGSLLKPMNYLAKTFVTPLFAASCCRRKKAEIERVVSIDSDRNSCNP